MRNLRSPHEFDDYPTYRDGVDPKTVEIREFISRYALSPPFRPCGIAGCHTPHRDGYLVRLHDGSVTNVGPCCAGKLSDFQEKFERWDKALRRHRLLRRIRIEKNRIDKNRRALDDLLVKNSQLRSRLRSFGMRFPASYAALKRRFCKNDLLVRTPLGRSAVERDDAAARKASQKREPVAPGSGILGQLAGMSVFRPPVSERLSELLAFLDELDAIVSIESLSDHRLSELELCIDFFDSQLAAIRARILDSKSFFSAHNYFLISQDEMLAAKERRILESYGCDAFMIGQFGNRARGKHAHAALERTTRVARKPSGHVDRAIRPKSRRETGNKRGAAKH